MALFFGLRSGELNLETGEIVDLDTGDVKCAGRWIRDIEASDRQEMIRLQNERDQSSDIINLPGNKPLFQYEDAGLDGYSPKQGSEAVCRGDDL